MGTTQDLHRGMNPAEFECRSTGDGALRQEDATRPGTAYPQHLNNRDSPNSRCCSFVLIHDVLQRQLPPEAEARRLLPIIGHVRPDGRIVLGPGKPVQTASLPGVRPSQTIRGKPDMVARGYYGLGCHEAAVAAFDRLKPFVEELLSLQGECEPMTADYSAIGIALEGLQTAAYHFTHRRHFYRVQESERPPYRPGNNRLGDRQAAIAAFEALTPYANALGKIQGGCRPFGRDYLALTIARQSLGTAAFHFTRVAHLYGAKRDSAGPVRPAL